MNKEINDSLISALEGLLEGDLFVDSDYRRALVVCPYCQNENYTPSKIHHANDCEVVQARIALRRARGE